MFNPTGNGDGSRSRRGHKRREVVEFTPEQLQQLNQDIALEERTQRTQRNMQFAVSRTAYLEATTYDQKAQAAQYMHQTMNADGLTEHERQQFGELTKGLKLDEFMSMHKTITDVTEIGRAAQKMSDPNAAFNPSRSLTQIVQDQEYLDSLDPVAKQLALDFHKGIGAYNEAREQETFTREQNPVPVPVDQQLILVPKGMPYDDSEGYGKDTIKDEQGRIFMKPNASDDPRGVGNSMGLWKTYMTFPPDHEQSRDGLLGTSLIDFGRNPNSSVVAKRVNQHLIDQAARFDPKRTRDMLKGGERTLNEQQKQNYKQDISREKGKPTDQRREIAKPQQVKAKNIYDINF